MKPWWIVFTISAIIVMTSCDSQVVATDLDSFRRSMAAQPDVPFEDYNLNGRDGREFRVVYPDFYESFGLTETEQRLVGYWSSYWQPTSDDGVEDFVIHLFPNHTFMVDFFTLKPKESSWGSLLGTWKVDSGWVVLAVKAMAPFNPTEGIIGNWTIVPEYSVPLTHMDFINSPQSYAIKPFGRIPIPSMVQDRTNLYFGAIYPGIFFRYLRYSPIVGPDWVDIFGDMKTMLERYKNPESVFESAKTVEEFVNSLKITLN